MGVCVGRLTHETELRRSDCEQFSRIGVLGFVRDIYLDRLCKEGFCFQRVLWGVLLVGSGQCCRVRIAGVSPQVSCTTVSQ